MPIAKKNISEDFERTCSDGSEDKELFQFYEEKEYYKK